ncbi:MAG: putative toxin-antitoxin system toxin component, PIN family [Sulfuricurvum sp.]|uniref:putative toxin-antitoxin system toxin component, PIN family n=1 Tax=Sulfuricurvum sp. TaxID=2025608 RepID=UPI00260BED11|nr:putative toxin-antitoxin system toxin component, PIN family [Sulfuricurvum sp.]MDD2830445.1 putative toxin-antitoxin system toxin component, PIN family [Sulfuricurvum sp.]MDD4950751.1 putative toxin-antitoxin system toxin component, PIN family [Sulfuricurvum sp.]
MKIVLDTNVIIAALMSRNGISNAVLIKLFETDEKINVVSNPLVLEMEAVLKRDENRVRCGGLEDEAIETFIDDLCLISHHQKINFLWRPFLHDPQDDMVLETAFNATAEIIVTYNLKDFKGVEKYFGIRVMTPKEFYPLLGGGQ